MMIRSQLMNFTVGRIWLRYFYKVYLSTRLLIASQFMLSYSVNAKFSYTRTVQGLELKVYGLGLGLDGLDYMT